jgi:hypothetical protein
MSAALDAARRFKQGTVPLAETVDSTGDCPPLSGPLTVRGKDVQGAGPADVRLVLSGASSDVGATAGNGRLSLSAT